MTYILGLNAYHGDAAACLVKDGKLIAAAEEERFRRVKHWAGFPSESIRYCLNEEGIEIKDVDTLPLIGILKLTLCKKQLVLFGQIPIVALNRDNLKRFLLEPGARN